MYGLRERPGVKRTHQNIVFRLVYIKAATN